jgi:hypothetical protein
MLVLPSRYCLRPFFSFRYLTDAFLHALFGHHDFTTIGTLTLEPLAREVGIDPIQLLRGSFSAAVTSTGWTSL